MNAHDITLSIVVNAHAEGRLLRPTLRSVAAGITELTAASIACELLIVLDNASPRTLAEARRWAGTDRLRVPTRLVEVAHGDVGASRNSGVEQAGGQYVALCDGDDLVSAGYFAQGVRALQRAEEPIIVHPATVVSFGARSAIWRIPPTEKVDALALIRDNQWPSASISRRSTYVDHPYRSIRPEEGFGPEDWLWNIETAIAGIPHRPVPGTMFFYRVREWGGVNNRHLRSILPGYDIEGLVAAMPPRIRPAKRPRKQHPVVGPIRRFLRSAYFTARPALRFFLGFLPQRSKERLYGGAVALYRGRPRRLSTMPKRRKVSAAVEQHLRRAAEIEPAISWTANGYQGVPEWQPHDDGYAEMLVELVAQLRPASRAIVAVPWVGIGGADLVSLNYARALAAIPRFANNVTMLATYTPARSLPHLVPAGVRFVQASQDFRALSPDRQRRILAQALLIVDPELVISVNCFDVTNSLQLYSGQLTTRMRLYLTLFAFDRIGPGYPVNPITDDGQREYLDEIAGVITDNSVTAGILSEMLALDDPPVQVHHQPALALIPEFRSTTRANSDSAFGRKAPFRVLWPHRLDKEKRPDALIRIAELLREQELPVQINVHGQQVLSSDGPALMTSLTEAGIKYRGPYSGGLAALPTQNYHALLLTSESEGLPLVLVQSMLLGLPVIATAVGGVTDIVRDGETGLLVAGPDDAEGFVRAIRRLMESLEERRRIIRTAYDFAASQHGWEHFTKLVESL